MPAGNWEEALALFRQAHALRPSARTLRGMGVASFEARHYADAIRYLTAAATETARPLTPEQLLAVEQLIPRARLQDWC
jgi:tetratricopeptide (TPR) repeat protein